MTAGLGRSGTVVPALLVACLGIVLYSVMDGLMKQLSLGIGAYSALVWRLAAGGVLTALPYAASRPMLPSRPVLWVHFARAVVVAIMAVAFFWGIARIPMAEAVGLSFIAPLIALGLAALFLHERVGGRAVVASLLGLVGVGVILGGRMGRAAGAEALPGAGAVLASAVFYAVNLVMARHQAQLARPLEIAFFQNLFVLIVLLPFAPFALALPVASQVPAVLGAAVLGVASLLLLSWANARAEAQVLVSVEYTAFVSSALTGWYMFGERLSWAMIGGTVLIVTGCVLAARRPVGAQEAEAALA